MNTQDKRLILNLIAEISRRSLQKDRKSILFKMIYELSQIILGILKIVFFYLFLPVNNYIFYLWSNNFHAFSHKFRIL